jgi:anti-anti-sigma factor
MEIVQYEKYGIIYVTVEGRSETELNAEFEIVIRNIVEGDNRRLLLDLSALQYLRSSALRVILNAVKVINRRSGKVVLCSLNGYVKEIFEGNCLKDTLTIADSVDSGLSALLRPLKAA